MSLIPHMYQIISSGMVKAIQVGTFNSNIFLDKKFIQMWEPMSQSLYF